jgi:hypothetical protein
MHINAAALYICLHSALLQFIFAIHLLASLQRREICDYLGDRLLLIG